MMPISLGWQEYILLLIFPAILVTAVAVALIRFRRWSLALLFAAALLNLLLMVGDLAVLRFTGDEGDVDAAGLIFQPPFLTENRGAVLSVEFPYLGFLPYMLWVIVIVGSIGEIARLRASPSTKPTEV